MDASRSPVAACPASAVGSFVFRWWIGCSPHLVCASLPWLGPFEEVKTMPQSPWGVSKWCLDWLHFVRMESKSWVLDIYWGWLWRPIWVFWFTTWFVWIGLSFTIFQSKNHCYDNFNRSNLWTFIVMHSQLQWKSLSTFNCCIVFISTRYISVRLKTSQNDWSVVQSHCILMTIVIRSL